MNCKKMSKKVAKGLKKVVRKCVQKSRKGARDMSAESRVGTPCRLRRKRVKAWQLANRLHMYRRCYGPQWGCCRGGWPPLVGWGKK